MRTSTLGRTLVAMALLAGLGACVSTSLIDRWKDPGFSGPALHKVLVVGVQRTRAGGASGKTAWWPP